MIVLLLYNLGVVLFIFPPIRAEGMAEGRAKGIAEVKKEIAKAMKLMGLTTEQIMEATGLTESDIERLG